MKSDYLKRGERLNPKMSTRNYWVLSELRRAIEEVIVDTITEDSRVVDFGCGNMPYRPLFEQAGAQYFGYDFQGNEMADGVFNEDGRLPVQAGSFDRVVSTQVLEHVNDPSKYLIEAHRVLQSEGLLILSTHGIWPYHPDPTDFWRWTGDGLVKIINNNGFSVCTIKGIAGPAATAIQLFQNAVFSKAHHQLRPFLFRLCQVMMKFFDARCPRSIKQKDAAVYIIVAKKV